MEKDWETWWNNEGSGYRPRPDEDYEEFAMRISRIAWANGAYCELKIVAKDYPNLFAIPERKTNMVLDKNGLSAHKTFLKEVKP